MFSSIVPADTSLYKNMVLKAHYTRAILGPRGPWLQMTGALQ